jgi:hypothetical protein
VAPLCGEGVRQPPNLAAEFFELFLRIGAHRVDVRDGGRPVFAVFRRDALNNLGSHRCGDGADQPDAADHQQDCHHSAFAGHRWLVAVSDGGDGGHRPPQGIPEGVDPRADRLLQRRKQKHQTEQPKWARQRA